MNKIELADAVAKRTSISKSDCEKMVNSVFEVIKDALSAGGKVQIAGFGIFEVAERRARRGRNPKTGEEIDVPATVMPKFTARKGLKDAVKA